MNFELSDDQSMLRDSVRRWIDSEYDFEHRQQLLREGGFSRKHWQDFADMGWLGVGLPETHGGLGGGLVDAAIVLEELGRGLVVEPYLASALLPALLLLDAAPEAQRVPALQALVAGETLWAVAHGEAAARGDDNKISTRADADGSGYRLSGCKTLVHAGAAADRYLVSARLADGRLGLFALSRGQQGTTLREYRLVDGSAAAELRLDAVSVAADVVLSLDACAVLARSTAAVTVCACAEMVGAMERALWMTRDYLQTRKQFGVAIGTFQALQHRMADMYVALEQARSIQLRGLAALQEQDDARLLDAASAAKAQVGKCAQFVSAQAIQLHGGIGVTDEYPIGHYFKRLLVLEAMYGNVAFHIGRLARKLRAAA